MTPTRPPKTAAQRENHRRAALQAMQDINVRIAISQKIAASWQNEKVRARRIAGLRAASARRKQKAAR